MPLYAPGGGTGAAFWDTIITKSQDQAVTNSAVLTADNELTFTVTAGLYVMEFEIWHTCTSLSNFKWEFTYPAVTDANQVVGFLTTYGTGGSIATTVPQSAVTGQWPVNAGRTDGQIGTGATKATPLIGRFVMQVASAGSITFNFCQGTQAAANNVTVLAGSNLRYNKLA